MSVSVDKFAAIGMLASTEPGRFADIGAIDATSLPSFSHFPGSDFIYTNFRRGRDPVFTSTKNRRGRDRDFSCTNVSQPFYGENVKIY